MTSVRDRACAVVQEESARRILNSMTQTKARFCKQSLDDIMTILDWQQYQCMGCGLDFREDPGLQFVIAYVHPLKRGRYGHDTDNIVLLCPACCKDKGHLAMHDFLQAKHGIEVAKKFMVLHGTFRAACRGYA